MRRLYVRKDIAASGRQRRGPPLSRNHRVRISPANGARQTVNWSIKGVGCISDTERNRVPKSGTTKVSAARQDAERVSRSSKRSINIAGPSNRTPSMGQAQQFSEKAYAAQSFEVVSGAARDMRHACGWEAQMSGVGSSRRVG